MAAAAPNTQDAKAPESKPQDAKPQDAKSKDNKSQDTKAQDKPIDTRNGDAKNGDVKFMAEQIVESVILVSGTRPLLDQIRRNGVERGKITRYNSEGNPEESNYERRFVRGENLNKDKIRLDFDTARHLFTLITVLHWKGKG